MTSRIVAFLVCLSLLNVGCALDGRGIIGAQQPETRFAPVDGGEIEYIVYGPEDGEPVLLLHGAWIADTFLPITAEPALADYRLILMHRRGYAGSVDLEAPSTHDQGVADALAVLEDLEVSRAHVVAHSWGGRIANHLARQRPEVVQSLVLAEPFPALPEDAPASMLGGGFVFTDEVIEATRAMDPSEFGEMNLVVGLGDDWQQDLDALSPDALEQFRSDAFEVTNYEFLAPTMLPNVSLPAGYYADITQPAMLLYGSETLEDGSTPNLAELLSNVDLYSVDGTGHWMLTEKPAESADAIAEFLAKHPM